MGTIREWGTNAGIKTAWWLVSASVSYVWYHPWQTLSSVFLIDRFGWAGTRFVGRAGWTMLKSQARLGIDISKIALQELGPAFKPNNLIKPFQRIAPRLTAGIVRGGSGMVWVARGVGSASRVAGPPALGLAVVYGLMQGSEWHMELATDPYSGAYVLNEDDTEIIGTPYLNGPTGTGFL